MTSTFDFVRDLIKELEEDDDKREELEGIVNEVFIFCSKRVKGLLWERTYFLKEDVRNLKSLSFKGTLLRQWNDYFEMVHIIDESGHRAFEDSGYKILYQLERVLKRERMVMKREFRTLFKYSPRADVWFHQNYSHIGEGVWSLRSSKKVKDRKSAKRRAVLLLRKNTDIIAEKMWAPRLSGWWFFFASDRLKYRDGIEDDNVVGNNDIVMSSYLSQNTRLNPANWEPDEWVVALDCAVDIDGVSTCKDSIHALSEMLYEKAEEFVENGFYYPAIEEGVQYE